MKNRLLIIALLFSSSFSYGGSSQTIAFRHFLYDFFQDPEFQINHVANPYTYTTTSGDEVQSQLVSTPKNLDNWKHLEGPEHYRCNKNCYDLMIYDNFDKKHKESGERVLAFEGVKNGIYEMLYFKLTGSEWFLVKYESFSN